MSSGLASLRGRLPGWRLRTCGATRALVHSSPGGRTLVVYKPTSPETADSGAAEPTSAESARHGHATTASHSSQTEKYHKVKKGETLSSIAETNHTSVAALKRDNPKLAANLRAGEVLVIKKQ